MKVIAVVVLMAALVSMTLLKLREPRSWKCEFNKAAEAMWDQAIENTILTNVKLYEAI